MVAPCELVTRVLVLVALFLYVIGAVIAAQYGALSTPAKGVKDWSRLEYLETKKTYLQQRVVKARRQLELQHQLYDRLTLPSLFQASSSQSLMTRYPAPPALPVAPVFAHREVVEVHFFNERAAPVKINWANSAEEHAGFTLLPGGEHGEMTFTGYEHVAHMDDGSDLGGPLLARWIIVGSGSITLRDSPLRHSYVYTAGRAPSAEELEELQHAEARQRANEEMQLDALRTERRRKIELVPPAEIVIPQLMVEGVHTTGPKSSFSSDSVSSKVHAFYYPWYGSEAVDGKFMHWNHPWLEHWDAKVSVKYPSGAQTNHRPPEDIGSNYYPRLGAYSSKDPVVVEDHMRQLKMAGIGVIVVSWFPPTLSDDNGAPLDPLFPLLLDVADKHGIKIAFHLEPYDSRTALSTSQDLEYIHATYSRHPAMYKQLESGKPIFYIYDSYRVKVSEWSRLFVASQGDPLCVRGKPHDGLFIGLVVEKKHMAEVATAGMDGFYTYFAAAGMSWGSTMSNWPELQRTANDKSLIFIPSVGPGYVDTEVRPWNAKTTNERKEGAYMETMFSAALALAPAPKIISITSFNEWHEGSQIEAAIAHPSVVRPFASQTDKSGTAANGLIEEVHSYLSYRDPDFYLTLTRKLVTRFEAL